MRTMREKRGEAGIGQGTQACVRIKAQGDSGYLYLKSLLKFHNNYVYPIPYNHRKKLSIGS